MLNARILCLFGPSLNAFKIQKFNMGFLTRIPGILIKLATRWVLLQLRKSLLELIGLANLEQYSQAIGNRLQLLNVSIP